MVVMYLIHNSIVVVGRMQLNTKGVVGNCESEGRCRRISGLTNRIIAQLGYISM